MRYRKGRWTSRAVLVRGGEAGSLSASTGCSRIWTIRLESEAVVCALSAVTRVNRACASALVPNLEIFFRTSHEQSSWCSRLSSGGRSCFFKAPGREWCWDSQPCAEVAVIFIDGSRLPRGWGRQARSHPCAGGDGGKTAVDFYQCCEVIPRRIANGPLAGGDAGRTVGDALVESRCDLCYEDAQAED